MFRDMRGLYTYDRIALANAHSIAQSEQSVDILLATVSEWDVLDKEAFIAPRLHGFDVKIVIFCCDVQHRRATPEGQPAIAIGKVLCSHS